MQEAVLLYFEECPCPASSGNFTRLTLELTCGDDVANTAGPSTSWVAALGPDWRPAHEVELEARVALQPQEQAGHVATVLLKKPAESFQVRGYWKEQADSRIVPLQKPERTSFPRGR